MALEDEQRNQADYPENERESKICSDDLPEVEREFIGVPDCPDSHLEYQMRKQNNHGANEWCHKGKVVDSGNRVP